MKYRSYGWRGGKAFLVREGSIEECDAETALGSEQIEWAIEEHGRCDGTNEASEWRTIVPADAEAPTRTPQEEEARLTEE